MPTFLAGLFALYLLLLAIKQFGRLSPADAAKIARKGGVALGVLGLVLLALRGSFGLAGAILAAVLSAAKGAGNPFANAFSGAGLRVAGASRFDGAVGDDRDAARSGFGRDERSRARRTLSGARAGLARAAGLPDLYRSCVRDDPEGATLLETYLDRRFAGWRDADEGQSEARRRGSRLGRDVAGRGLRSPGPAEGRERRGNRPRAPEPDEEASSRSWRLDRSGRAGQSGQGCFA